MRGYLTIKKKKKKKGYPNLLRGLYSMLGHLRNLWENTVRLLVVVSLEPRGWPRCPYTGLPVNVLAWIRLYHKMPPPLRLSAGVPSRE